MSLVNRSEKNRIREAVQAAEVPVELSVNIPTISNFSFKRLLTVHFDKIISVHSYDSFPSA